VGQPKLVKLDTGKLLRGVRAALNAGPSPDKSSSGSASPDTDGPAAVILVLSGALNPVHVGHAQILLKAGECMSKAYPGRLTFAGGVLAPSSHSYVKGKLGINAMWQRTRDWLCALAAEGNDLLTVAPYGMASGGDVCDKVLSDLRDAEREELSATAGKFQPIPWKRVRILAVYGTDFYTKYGGKTSKPRVIISREDSEGSAVEAKKLFMFQKEHDVVHPDFLFLELDPAVRVPDFSSTAIREAFAKVGIVPPFISKQGRGRAGSNPQEVRSEPKTPGSALTETATPPPQQSESSVPGETASPVDETQAAMKYLRGALHDRVLNALLGVRPEYIFCDPRGGLTWKGDPNGSGDEEDD
jgi:hypothetical protein